MPNQTPLLVTNIILHIILISTFISIFFFLYAGKQIEPKVITSQVDRVIEELTEDMKIILSDSQKQQLKTIFSNMTPPDMTEEDKKAAESNKQLLKNAAIFLGVTLVVGFIIIAILVFKYKIDFKDLKEILIENMVILLCVAATEFAFLSFIAKSYRSLDPNTIKAGLINTLDNYSKS